MKLGIIWWHNGLHKCRQKSMELIAVAALLRKKELVSVGDVLRRKSILRTIDSSGGGGLKNNRIMLYKDILG